MKFVWQLVQVWVGIWKQTTKITDFGANLVKMGQQKQLWHPQEQTFFETFFVLDRWRIIRLLYLFWVVSIGRLTWNFFAKYKSKRWRKQNGEVHSEYTPLVLKRHKKQSNNQWRLLSEFRCTRLYLDWQFWTKYWT